MQLAVEFSIKLLAELNTDRSDGDEAGCGAGAGGEGLT